MAEFLAIVSIIAGILQIVLFFKVWSMANNVEKLVKIAAKSSGVSQDGHENHGLNEPNDIDTDKDKETTLDLEVHYEASQAHPDWYYAYVGNRYIGKIHKSKLSQNRLAETKPCQNTKDQQ